ncbi:hypothetical protein [Emticicia sp. BO119]|uniref:hypothetical protein n=1 Tax=Emticicia sp. BO119 TaxID=2757768 RepID=UPI0015F0F152|nr:hypothetical protein [Emticicia sp. BO119]MBA4849468.1 hypothetical protein [Emticicia sp. BO119]
MNARVKQLWIDALRSGRYYQTFHEFRVQFINDCDCYCASGVLMHLYSQEVTRISNWDSIPIEVLEWAELPTATPSPNDSANEFSIYDVIELNDGLKSFAEIADFIEEHF